MANLAAALFIVAAYLLGSVPVGVLVGRCYGFDPRTVGSGNVGMTNVARAGGAKAAALTFAGDMLKGFIPMLVARRSGLTPPVLALVGFAAFAGAIASVFMRFQGGRGVATSAGIWLVLAPLPTGIAIVVFILIFTVSRIVSLASIGAAVATPPAVAAAGCARPYILLAIVMAALVLFRHRANIQRLLKDEEPILQFRRDGKEQ